jgi:protein-L-isoaspartate O-methyltransferase
MDLFSLTFTASVVAILSILFIIFLALNLFIPVTKGAPFVVSDPVKRKTMLKLAEIKKGESLVDLGSGDGTLVILFAKAGAKAYGYEINPFLVWKSRRKIKKEKLESSAIIYWKSFWLEDLSNYDIITVYGIKFIMKDLEKKLQKQAKKGTRIISNYYTFPTLKPVQSEQDVHLYIL